ncbi:MAG TPA: S46 family peptidase, partial [Paludibacteraceae bacterium]|nr:S46 family peptidase [Paludibacteraceae bacterium]
MKRIIVFLSIFLLFVSAKADEGMWMLPYIHQLNIQKMNGMGCSLSAEDIYSDKNISLKDAVIVFGNGCTGVVVSRQGLIFTNHHCGFDAIQQHSSVEHNYLKDGFNAVRLEDEIPTPGLSVKFLVKIEDVTKQVFSRLPDTLSEKSRNGKINEISDSISKAAEKDTHYLAEVKPFFAGNEFYLLVYEEFKDVRLAFAPPSSIGNFGGDTDNWMWPRHTGDFSVFRVYASPDGQPAEYSKNNVPYAPKRFAAISNKGYQPNDFTMILGNPGSTSRYLTSFGVKFRMETGNQARIDVRGVKQTIWRSFMRKDEAINIAYANKYASSSNYWKNSIGMNKAIQRLNVVERKKEQEAAFLEWAKSNPAKEKKYKEALKTLEDGYATLYPYARALNYLRESLMNGVELPRIAQKTSQLISQNLPKDSLMKEIEEIYKDYRPEVDQAVFAAMLDVYKKSVDADALPA